MRQAGCWLRSRFGDTALILGYHRVAEPPVDSYGLCVRPAHFAEQMEVLRRRANVIDMGTLQKCLVNRNLPRRAVVITFDDGYADNLHAARPLLAANDLPATVFVTSGSLGNEFWWDTLERLVFSPAKLPERLALPVNGHHVNWSLLDPARKVAGEKREAAVPRKHLLHLLHESLQAQPPGEKTAALGRLRTWVETACPPRPPEARAMTAEELRAIADDGLLTVGAHGVNHQPLTALPAAMQKEQIAGSKAMLTAILDQPVLDFSYPHGAVSSQTLRLVQEGGFQLACTSHPDMVRAGSNQFALPRFWPPDWDGERFSRWLHRWLHA